MGVKENWIGYFGCHSESLVTAEIWRILDMSLLNLTGEDADPVKALVFRELWGESKRRKEEEDLVKEEEDSRMVEEKKEKNRRWRERREEREKERAVLDLNWEEENESDKTETKKSNTCICL